MKEVGTRGGGLHTLDVQEFISHARKQDLFEEMFPSKPKAANGRRNSGNPLGKGSNSKMLCRSDKTVHTECQGTGERKRGCQTFRVQGRSWLNEDPLDTVSLF